MKLSKGVVVARLEGKWLVYVGKQEMMYEFNEVGGVIMNALQEGKKTIKEIVAVIVDMFEVEAEEAEKDVGEFVKMVKEKGLVED